MFRQKEKALIIGGMIFWQGLKFYSSVLMQAEVQI